jgi:peptidoglycan glycosyltransferase
VALDPKTGKVLVMATSPSYNPNRVEEHFSSIAAPDAPCSPAAPLLNRATNGLYPPGSTFKVVTSAAALDSGRFSASSTFRDPGYCVEYGKKVSNFADQNGPEVFGTVDFTQALQHSINAVFCDIGMALGPKLILDYAKRFGFYRNPDLELPRSEQSASGLYVNHRPWLPKHPNDVDVGRLAFGQERLLASPLQMAMVAAAVADGGKLMKPYLVDRVLTPGNKGTVFRTKPRELDQAVKPETAATLTRMMEAVVTGGTGTAARIPGTSVAGKTGTAESDVPHRNTTWFISFAPSDDAKVAVAVVLENQTATGGTTAAPIAKEIMQAILRQTTNP